MERVAHLAALANALSLLFHSAFCIRRPLLLGGRYGWVSSEISAPDDMVDRSGVLLFFWTKHRLSMRNTRYEHQTNRFQSGLVEVAVRETSDNMRTDDRRMEMYCKTANAHLMLDFGSSKGQKESTLKRVQAPSYYALGRRRFRFGGEGGGRRLSRANSVIGHGSKTNQVRRPP